MSKSSVGCTCMLAVLTLATVAVTFSGTNMTRAISPLQSCVLPTGCDNNPKFIFAKDGGRRYCGLDQGAVWLDFVRDFTTEGGAEVHCDVTPLPPDTDAVADALNRRLLQAAWGTRGYLIGIYPQVPISKAINMTFEINPVRAQGICRTCFVGRFYDPKKSRWQDLTTTYDQRNSRVTVFIDKALPLSEYPAHPNKHLVALFRRR